MGKLYSALENFIKFDLDGTLFLFMKILLLVTKIYGNQLFTEQVFIGRLRLVCHHPIHVTDKFI